MAARAGHDLTIEITSWSAQVEVPDEDAGGVTSATVTARLDLGSLAVREGSGGAKPLSDSDRRDIKKTSGGAIEGTLTIKGKSQPVRLQVTEPSRASTVARRRSSRRRSGSSRTRAS